MVGIPFAVLLLLAGGMVSLPTADDPPATIVAFYAAHGSVVVAAQIIGAIALLPFAMFGIALARRAPDGSHARRIIGSGIIVIVTEVATNVPPLVLALGTPTPSSAHTWTFAADLADAALLVALGLFALATSTRQPAWARRSAVVVAVLAFARAVASPLGFTVRRDRPDRLPRLHRRARGDHAA
jgi:hypothetical protein